MCLDQTTGCFMSPYAESVIEQVLLSGGAIREKRYLLSEVKFRKGTRKKRNVFDSEPLFVPSLCFWQRDARRHLVMLRASFLAGQIGSC